MRRRHLLLVMFACVVASGGLAATDAESTMAASVWPTCSAGGAPPDDCNAWYRTSVTLQWHWSPTEGVMSTSGCDVQTLSIDTPSSGTPKTCEVEWLNGDTVISNGTLLDGAVVETARTASSVQLSNGTRLSLSPASRARVYGDRMILEKGETRIENVVGFHLEALGLVVRPGVRQNVRSVGLQL